MMKSLIVIVLLVVAAAGLWWSGLLKDYLPANFSAFGTKAPAEEPVASTTQQQQPVSDLPTNAGDSSDAAIVQDSAAVDAQLKGLDSDEASADQGLNDKPTAQEF